MFGNDASRVFFAHIQITISPRQLVVDQRSSVYSSHQMTYFLHARTC